MMKYDIKNEEFNTCKKRTKCNTLFLSDYLWWWKWGTVTEPGRPNLQKKKPIRCDEDAMCDAMQGMSGLRRTATKDGERNGKGSGANGSPKSLSCYSALNRAPPPPPRMIAFIKAKNRSPYSFGGTGLILCWKPHTNIISSSLAESERATSPYQQTAPSKNAPTA